MQLSECSDISGVHQITPYVIMVTLLQLRIQFVFVDSDSTGDIDHRRSTSGYVFTMFGGAISWMSKRQPVVALSTIEAEYMAATYACN